MTMRVAGYKPPAESLRLQEAMVEIDSMPMPVMSLPVDYQAPEAVSQPLTRPYAAWPVVPDVEPLQVELQTVLDALQAVPLADPQDQPTPRLVRATEDYNAFHSSLLSTTRQHLAALQRFPLSLASILLYERAYEAAASESNTQAAAFTHWTCLTCSALTPDKEVTTTVLYAPNYGHSAYYPQCPSCNTNPYDAHMGFRLLFLPPSDPQVSYTHILEKHLAGTGMRGWSFDPSGIAHYDTHYLTIKARKLDLCKEITSKLRGINAHIAQARKFLAEQTTNTTAHSNDTRATRNASLVQDFIDSRMDKGFTFSNESNNLTVTPTPDDADLVFIRTHKDAILDYIR